MENEYMLEKERLKQLYSYQILDTDPELELDEITQLASLICGVPIALIGLVDKDRQWFKSTFGIAVSEIPRKEAFCHRLISEDIELLEIENTHADKRFENDPVVVAASHIQFYAGVPLKSPAGHVLGTLCVMDTQPNKLSEDQKKGLLLLAKKATDFLNTRRTLRDQKMHIDLSASRLKQIMDNVPGVVFQIRIASNLDFSFDFLSKGIEDVHPDIEQQCVVENPIKFIDYIHPEDKKEFLQTVEKAANTLSSYKFTFRIVWPNGQTKWFKLRASPKKIDNAIILWFGTLLDVSGIMEYESILEQITFDISHVIRNPLTNLQGLSTVLKNEDKLSECDLRNYAEMISIVIEELDIFTRKLDQFYQLKIADHQSRV